MARLPDLPGPFRAGDEQVSAKALNWMIVAIMRQFFGGENVDVEYLGDRLRIGARVEVPYRRDVSDYIVRFLVVEELDDCLKCAPLIYPVNADDSGRWDNYYYGSLTSGGAFVRHPAATVPSSFHHLPVQTMPDLFIYVAKPHDLQKSAFDWLTPAVANSFVAYLAWLAPQLADKTDTGSSPYFVYNYLSRNRREVRPVLVGSNGEPYPVVASPQSHYWSFYDVNVESVQPPYLSMGMIEARAGVTGVYGPDGLPISWMDVNASGRAWRSDRVTRSANVQRWNPSSDTNDGSRKVISLPDGNSVRAFSGKLVSDSTGYVDPETFTSFSGNPWIWLVPTVQGNTCYYGKVYQCWKGPYVNDHQLFYTQGEPKPLFFQPIIASFGASSFGAKLMKPSFLGAWVEDEDYNQLINGPYAADGGTNSFTINSPNGQTMAWSTDMVYKCSVLHESLSTLLLSTRIVAEYTPWHSRSVPSTSSSVGNVGDYAIDTSFLYVCVNTNTWKRIALSTF
jgi:hypothetical protein